MASMGWVDLACPGRTYILPRKAGECRSVYVKRFFAEMRGVGQCALVTVRGSRRRVRARR
jgi:hypothetical protein